MIRLIGWSIVVVAGLLANVSHAAPLVIDDSAVLDRLPIAPQIEIYTGEHLPSGALAAAEFPDADYTPVGTASPLELMQTQWFRFSIHNASSRTRSLVFDFDQALYSRIDWYSRVGTDFRAFVTGQNYPYASRDLYYNYFAFHLDIPPGETAVINFSIYTPFVASFVPILSDSEKFTEHLAQIWQFSGSVIGMLYAVALFLLIYIVRVPGQGAARAMLGQVIFSILSVLYLGGIFQRWLPDADALWRNIAYILIHGGQGICYTLAVRSFFQAPTYFPIVNKFLLLLVFATLSCLLWLPFINIDYLLVGTLAINFWMMVFSVAVAITSLVKQQKGTTLFAVGLMLFVLMTVISVMGSAGVLPASFLTRYSYELGLTIQADFLFLAIAMRIFNMEHDKLHMQEEILRMETEMKVRSEFVERVTHDIKSPLSAVLGAAQLLQKKYNLKEAETYLGIIQRSCGVVISIVDDILSHSRMTANQMSLHIKPFSLQELLADIETSIKVSQQRKGVFFSMTISQDIPAVIEGDKLRVSQLLINLLTNAFKFTDEGRVNFTVDLAEKTESRVRVRFVIQDTGIGMSEGFLRKAFEPYSREEHNGSYRSGFGLGLSICKQIVDLMGGSIDVLSAAGQGSRFTVVLPFVVSGQSSQS